MAAARRNSTASSRREVVEEVPAWRSGRTRGGQSRRPGSRQRRGRARGGTLDISATGRTTFSNFEPNAMRRIVHNPDNGEIVWGFQTTPHDGWDYDGVNEFVPFEALAGVLAGVGAGAVERRSSAVVRPPELTFLCGRPAARRWRRLRW